MTALAAQRLQNGQLGGWTIFAARQNPPENHASLWALNLLDPAALDPENTDGNRYLRITRRKDRSFQNGLRSFGFPSWLVSVRA